MSMISEQVKELRKIAKYWEYDSPKKPIPQILNEAADAIECLTAKLQAANMERSERYYNDGWILCSDRLPEENEVVLLTFQNSAGLYVGESTYKESMFFYITDTEFGYYEEVFNNPIAWQPLPEPYEPQ